MRLLYVSDVHFRKNFSNTHTDPDLQLRKEIIWDAERQVKSHGSIDRIIVGGDIAYGGLSEEYAMATDWLMELKKSADCPDGGVFVVPGNHDVDRQVTGKDIAVMNVQRAIHGASDKGAELRRQLAHDVTARDLIKPIAAYNEFARQFDCQIYGLEKLFWRHVIPIDANVSLALFGLTTIFLSGQNGENDIENQHLYLSTLQTQLLTEPGFVNGVMCHHPPDWLIDKDEVDEAFCNRAIMQFFGHKHRLRITREQDYIRFAAAAVNPNRKEKNWEPGYNIVDVTSKRVNDDLVLFFESHLMTWQTNPDKLVAKEDKGGSSVFKHQIIVPNFHFATSNSGDMNKTEVPKVTSHHSDELKKSSLVMRFWQLTSSGRREIAEDLGVLQAGEIDLDETIRYGRVLDRIYEEGLLDQLRTAIEEKE